MVPDRVVWMGWLAVSLTDDCGLALLSGSGGFVAGFCSDVVSGKTVVYSVTCCSFRLSEIFTSSLVGVVMPLKDFTGTLL